MDLPKTFLNDFMLVAYLFLVLLLIVNIFVNCLYSVVMWFIDVKKYLQNISNKLDMFSVIDVCETDYETDYETDNKSELSIDNKSELSTDNELTGDKTDTDSTYEPTDEDSISDRSDSLTEKAKDEKKNSIDMTMGKINILRQLAYLKESGVQLSRDYNFSDDISLMKLECDYHMENKKKMDRVDEKEKVKIISMLANFFSMADQWNPETSGNAGKLKASIESLQKNLQMDRNELISFISGSMFDFKEKGLHEEIMQLLVRNSGKTTGEITECFFKFYCDLFLSFPTGTTEKKLHETVYEAPEGAVSDSEVEKYL